MKDTLPRPVGAFFRLEGHQFAPKLKLSRAWGSGGRAPGNFSSRDLFSWQHPSVNAKRSFLCSEVVRVKKEIYE